MVPRQPGRILYCTTGILLMRLRKSPSLKGTSTCSSCCLIPRHLRFFMYRFRLFDRGWQALWAQRMTTACHPWLDFLQSQKKTDYTVFVKVTEKAFHKNAKTCRAGFHKKPTKQDGTHMTIRSQITIPTSIFPTTHTIISYSLFWDGCVYMCVVNSRIGLWGLWVEVCIEGSRE